MVRQIVVFINEETLWDIEDIADWYNKKRFGLGERFKNQVKAQINLLKHHPQMNAIRYTNVRCIVVNKFPYLIHYVFNRDTMHIEVFAITSTKRKTFW